MAIQKVSLRKRGTSFALGDTLMPITDYGYLLNVPSTFNPAPHNTYHLDSVDVRNDNEDPSFYHSAGKGTHNEFKSNATIGIVDTGTYCHLMTYVPWSDGSGGYPHQVAFSQSGKVFRRMGLSNTLWGAWAESVTNERSGFNPGVSYLLSINESTRQVTITPSGTVKYWSNGIEYVMSTHNITIPDTMGEHYIYKRNGDWYQSQTPWDRSIGDVPVVLVIWNSVQNKCVILGYEPHSWVMDWATHLRLHREGTLFVGGASLTIVNTTAVEIDACDMMDEDIFLRTLTNIGLDQSLNYLSAPKYYRLGASGDIYKIDKSNDTCYLNTGVAQVNVFSGGTWGLNAVNNNKYFVSWLIHTNDVRESYAWLLGQVEGDSANDARNLNTVEGLDLAGLEMEENVLVGRLLMKRSGSSYEIIEWKDYRNVKGSGTTLNLTDHNHEISDISDYPTTPVQPTSLSLVEYSTHVEIGFTKNADNVEYYDIFSSIGNESNFALIGRLTHSDYTTTLVVNDTTYDRKTTIYYRVVAVNHGERSVVRTGNIVLSENVSDVTNLRIQRGVGIFHLTWENPEDPRLSDVNIYVDYETTSGALSKPASPVYSGKVENFDYEVADAYLDYYHQFWVEPVTRV